MPESRIDLSRISTAVATTFVLWAAPAEAGCLPDTIADGAYIGIADGGDATGTDAGMLCCPVDVTNLFPGTIEDVNVSLAITHLWLGDLVVKLKSPTGTVSTVLSRPGVDEPTDENGYVGSDADWDGDMILFDEQSGGPSTELMGTFGNPVCGGRVGDCEYTPDQGAGQGAGLDVDFDGESYAGLWDLCVGDADQIVEGTWNDFELSFEIDRSIPCVCANKFRGGDRVRYTGSDGADPANGTEGEVMCGQTEFGSDPILVAWDGFVGHDGAGVCACPTGSMATSNGRYVECDQLEFVLPFKDDFETGNFIRWSAVQGSSV